MTEIKACPFCGGEAEYKRLNTKTAKLNEKFYEIYTDSIWCKKYNEGCQACMMLNRYKFGEMITDEEKEKNANELIEMWNRRTGQ